MTPTGDVLEPEDTIQPSIGCALSLDTAPCKVPERAFPPGFAGANPGPSHEPAQKKPRGRG